MALLDELGGRTCSTTSYLLKHHISVIEADFTAQASCFTEAVVGPDHPIVPLSFLHDNVSPSPNINLIVAAADPGGDEPAGGVDPRGR
jgi:hypothetical protein